MKLISTAEAASKLGVHITRVQVLIREGRLPAQMIGGSYVIDEGDLKLVAERKPGRPRKVPDSTTGDGAAETQAPHAKRHAGRKGAAK